MDDRTTGESPHELLLALAGRIDDDLLAWCRELVAVGEDSRALELITATLIADRTPLPAPARAALIGATRTARTDLDAGSALAPAATEDGTAHRFDTGLPGAQDLAAAVGALPTRQIAGCRSWVTMRTTPAGSAPGPLPQPVVLVEVGADDTRPVDIMAYQLAIACARTGAPAAVEVLVAGTDRPAYHEAALVSAIAVHGADEPAPEPPAVDEPVPAAGPAPELLSPGSPDTMLANTGPVPVEQPVADTPRPLPRRATREDDPGAAFRAASAQAPPSGVRSAAPEPFASGLFDSAAEPEPLDARPIDARPIDAQPLDDGLFDSGPADPPSAADPSAADPSAADSPAADSPAAGSPAADPPTTEPAIPSPDGPSDSETTEPGTTGAGPSGPGTTGLPRRPRPVTALRSLSPSAPRPTPVRPSAVTPMPRPVPSPGRRGNLSPVAEPAATPAHTPAFAFLGDPLDGPVEERPGDERGEPVIDANDPLGLGLLPVPAPEVPGPPAEPVSDSWLADWITGDWAMSPSVLDDPPARREVGADALGSSAEPAVPDPASDTRAAEAASEVRSTGPRPSPRPEPAARPDPARTGRRRADADGEPFPAAAQAHPDRPRPSPVASPRPAPAAPPVPAAPAVPAAPERAAEPPESSLEQTGFVLRPESVARLSEGDRELLARLQAELAGTPRPRVTRRAGIGGTNGSATNGSGPPPDRAG